MRLTRQNRPPARAETKPRAAALALSLAVFALALAEGRAAHASVTRARAQEQVIVNQGQGVTVRQGQKGAEKAAAERAQSVVRGRVTYEDTDRPVRRARVYINDPSRRDGRGHRMSWTNGRGEFVLRNIPAGQYYVTAEASGVVRNSPDSPDALKESPSVSVDGTNTAEVRLRVRRGGAISGKVTHADGSPAADAQMILRRRKDGQLTVFRAGSGWRGMEISTDDRGVYRLAGLPPGEYVVGAAEQKMAMGEQEEDGSMRVHQSAVSTTFYPGAVSPRQATAVTVGAGDEVEDIDITLVERGAHNVSGTVVERATGRPVANAEITLQPKDEAADPERSAQPPTTSTDAQGRWWLDEVEVGSYALVVSPREVRRQQEQDTAAAATVAPRGFAVKRQDLFVAGGDVAGLVIEVSSGGRVSGTVSVEGGRPLPPDTMVFTEVETADRTQRFASTSAPVRPDGTFTLDGLPEAGIHLRAYVSGRHKYYLKSVTSADGTDLRGAPLRVEEGAEVKGVRVVLSPDVATVSGRVLTAQGDAPARGAFVMLVPTEPSRRRLRGARLVALTNPDGGFHLVGAPGEYAAIVLRPGEQPRFVEDANFEARFDAARRVTLRPGETTTVTLNAPADK